MQIDRIMNVCGYLSRRPYFWQEGKNVFEVEVEVVRSRLATGVCMLCFRGFVGRVLARCATVCSEIVHRIDRAWMDG